MSFGTLLLFARHPHLGGAKTRLAATRRADGTTLGPEGAARLHRAFLDDTLASCRAAGARIVLAHTAGPPFPRAALADDAFEQRGETFGERLDHAFAEARGRGVPGEPLAVIGSDTPHLAPRALTSALGALRTNDAVLGPSTKGGFYLLGFRREPVPIAGVFDAPDECAGVADVLERAGLGVLTLPPYWDLDEPEDVEALLVRFAREGLVAHRGATPTDEPEWVPRATVAALHELGLAG